MGKEANVRGHGSARSHSTYRAMTSETGSGSVVAASQAPGWVSNQARVRSSGAVPGKGSSTASNRPCSVPSRDTATDAKERIELIPGHGPSSSTSVTT
ncbi:unannotated protein [freshwater metagenome]|uniref:Unannotated protein n=1 Tax=freshwater metagenome TaxID=449393 RepID=A0A6J6RCA9_9ZZZZ